MPSRPSLCFFNTSPAMPHMLLGEGPQQAGGAEVQASILGLSLARRGWPVSFAVYDYGQAFETQTPEGVRVIKASGERSGLDIVRLLTDILPADRRAFRAADADIYIEMGISWRTGLLARLCRRQGRRFILWLASITDPLVADPKRSRVPRYSRWLAHHGLKQADLVIAQTHEQSRIMQELHGRECPVIPNVWMETEPVVSRDREPVGPGKLGPEVLWVARYLPLKRPEWVIEIARLLPDIRFVMVGGPCLQQEALFERVQAAAGELPNVEIVGFVPFAQMDAYYRRASALLCTSTIEGFPNTFLQAWAHKMPVVSTLDPDHVLQDNGLGIAGTTVGELAEALRRTCGPEGVAMGERCREYLERVHSVEAVLAPLESLLLKKGAEAAS